MKSFKDINITAYQNINIELKIDGFSDARINSIIKNLNVQTINFATQTITLSDNGEENISPVLNSTLALISQAAAVGVEWIRIYPDREAVLKQNNYKGVQLTEHINMALGIVIIGVDGTLCSHARIKGRQTFKISFTSLRYFDDALVPDDNLQDKRFHQHHDEFKLQREREKLLDGNEMNR